VRPYTRPVYQCGFEGLWVAQWMKFGSLMQYANYVDIAEVETRRIAIWRMFTFLPKDLLGVRTMVKSCGKYASKISRKGA